jgi:hypothetical protein
VWEVVYAGFERMPEAAARLVFNSSLAFLLCVPLLDRQLIMEDGIRHGDRLLSWDQIQAYDWRSRERAQTLRVVMRSGRAASAPIELRVPMSRKDAVEALLLRKLSSREPDALVEVEAPTPASPGLDDGGAS